jgi:hypothetical protein
MVKSLEHAQFLRLDIKRGYYILQALVDNQLLQIHWALTPTTLQNLDYYNIFSKNGKNITEEIVPINDSPVYVYITS